MDRLKREYTTFGTAMIHRIDPPSRLIAALEKGFLTADYAPAAGSGSKRLLSFQNVIEVGVWKRLFDAGLKPHTLKRMMDALRESRTLDNIYKIYLPGHDCLGGYRTSTTDPETGRGHIKRDVEHQGSLWWVEGRLPIITGDPAAISGYGEKRLVPEVLCHPPDAVQTQWITRKKGLKDVGCIYGIDLGEIERRVCEATAE